MSTRLVKIAKRNTGVWDGKKSQNYGEVITMMISVFIGVSVDGFIARKNGDLDFLPPGGGEPHGYHEFMTAIDAIVIGRKTFETVLGYDSWPYGAKRVVVLSGQPLDISRVRGGIVEHMDGSPEEIVAKLTSSGVRNVYIDGGVTIQRFLCAGLVTRMIITRVPVLIGEGIPLFGPLDRDIKLQHVATEKYKSGLVKSEYRIA